MGRPTKEESDACDTQNGDLEIYPGSGITVREVQEALPKPDLSLFATGDVEAAVEANRAAVLGQLYLRFFMGDKGATSVIGKLNTEPLLAKARIRMIASPNGTKAAEVTGPANTLLDAILRGGMALPKDPSKGIQALQEIR